MKLINKYNLVNLVTTVSVIIVTGIIYYFTISNILTDEIDKDLLVEENEVFDYVHLNHRLPQVFKSNDQQIAFNNAGNGRVVRQYFNTRFFNSQEREKEPGRGLITSVIVNGQNYRVQIIESKVKTEFLIRIIFFITLGVIVTLLLILFIINRLAVKKLWQPFYLTLNQVQLFNVTDKTDISLAATDTDEFRDLDTAITVMAKRVKRDYSDLKSFIENASHELLTPIAVIKSKMDTLLQTEGFNPRQSDLLNDVYKTVSKLTRLNKAMLLLSKIENQLIYDSRPINIKQFVQELLNQFHELFINKEILVETDLDHVELTMNSLLLDALLNNLLSNAVRHNINGGKIIVSLNPMGLAVKNTGSPLALDAGQIFKRFSKSAESEGSGLGLTLSKQICENYGFQLLYTYIEPFHTFTIYFNK